jgi:hypothetical protein
VATAIGDLTMTIEFAAGSIGILLIVGGALIWKKLRVVDEWLTLMQNELALMQNGIKDPAYYGSAPF